VLPETVPIVVARAWVWTALPPALAVALVVVSLALLSQAHEAAGRFAPGRTAG
jgi:ABC-type dipeptide/oligopeptide/nickel transport system permease subunit